MAERFDEIIPLMKDGVYSKELLYDLIFRVHPDYSPNSCEWLIGSLLQRGKIYSLGYGYYQVSKKRFFHQETSPVAKKIFGVVKDICPFSPVVIYDTNFVNELLKMEDGPKAYVVEVEKDQAFGIYYELHNRVSKRIMVNPSEHDLQMFFENDSIIVRKIFSKSPSNKDGSICLEKFLVDLMVDPFIYNLYGGIYFGELVKSFIKEYDLNFSTLLNYAKRRRCDELMYGLLVETLPEKAITILPRR